MGHAGVDEHGIALARVEPRSVADMHSNDSTVSQILLRHRAERRMNLTGDHNSGGSHHFSDDGAVVTCACTEVIDAIGRSQVERVDVVCQRAGLAVGEIARTVKREDLRCDKRGEDRRPA